MEEDIRMSTGIDNLVLEFPDQQFDPNSKRKTSMYESYDDIDTRRYTAQLIPPLTSRTSLSRCSLCFVSSLALVSIGFMAVGLLFFTGVLGAESAEKGPEFGFQIGGPDNSSEDSTASSALKDLMDHIDSLKQAHDLLNYKITLIQDSMNQIESTENDTTELKIMENSLKLADLEENMNERNERLDKVAQQFNRIHRQTQSQKNLINTLQDDLSSADSRISSLLNETEKQKIAISEMNASSVANSDIISALIAMHSNDSVAISNLHQIDNDTISRINDTVSLIETTRSTLESQLAEFNITSFTDIISTSKREGAPGFDGPAGPMSDTSLSLCQMKTNRVPWQPVDNGTSTAWLGDAFVSTESQSNGELFRMLWSGCSVQGGTEAVLQVRGSDVEQATQDFRCYCYGPAEFDHYNGRSWCTMYSYFCPSIH